MTCGPAYRRPYSVYVAASQHEWRRARMAMLVLRDAGLEVSHDWTAEFADATFKPSEQELEQFAIDDYNGVHKADAILVLTPARKDWGCAMWSELGVALAKGKRMIVTGPNRDRNIFARLGERYEHDHEGIACLIEDHG